MRLRGIHYDVGTATIEGRSTRPELAPEVVEREIADICGGLHATTVRIVGGDMGRIADAGAVAAHNGLAVWLSPMLPNADDAETLAAIEDTAQTAESLRRGGARVTLVVGCELSVFMAGILPGTTHADRLALLTDPARLVAEVTAAGLDPEAALAAFLGTAAERARGLFGGPLAYAAGAWEQVDWSLFDVVGIDAYRDAGNRGAYREQLRALAGGGRPVVVTEVGCATYRGAADAGGLAWTVVERGAEPVLRAGTVRDEAEQAREITSLLQAIDDAGIEGAFVYTYVAPSYPSSPDPRADLDAASYALMRSWPDGRTEPKAAYHAVAEQYSRS